MLKNISNLGVVLNKQQQHDIKGGTESSLMCSGNYGNVSWGIYHDSSGYYSMFYHQTGQPRRTNISGLQAAISVCDTYANM